MNIFEKIQVARKVLKAIIFKRRFPLVVSWDLTYRCNLQCKYCGYWERKMQELDTKDILSLIEQLAYLGTKFIGFSGGESLLRDDFREIIEHCRAKNIYVGLDSNGTLVKKSISKIHNLNEIKFSFDGPRHIHDDIRGRGVHDQVLEAIEICKKEQIKVYIRTVISKSNISFLPYVLKVAERYKIKVDFQPADKFISGNSSKNIPLIPEAKEYKKAINYLIKEKLKGYPFINNSLSGLRHLYHWPNPKKIFCLASLIFCSIRPDGGIFICINFPHCQNFFVPKNNNFKESFDSLSLPYPCKRCWCGSMVEFNLIGSFKSDSIIGLWGRFS